MYNIPLKQEENGRKGGRRSNIFLMLPWFSLRFQLTDIFENSNHMIYVYLNKEKSCNLKFIHSFPKWIYDGKQPHKKRHFRSSSRLSNINLWNHVSLSNYIKKY